MAIVAMKKLKVVALSKEKERVMDALKKVRCFEIKAPDEIEGTHKRLNVKREQETETKLSRLSFAIDFINEQRAERIKFVSAGLCEYTAPKKKGLFAVRDEVSFDEFIDAQSSEYELFAVVSELEAQNARLLEIKSEKVRLQNNIDMLKPFSELDIAPDAVKDTRNTCAFIGTVQSAGAAPLEKIKQIELADLEIIEENGSLISLAVVCHKSARQEVADALTEAGFVRLALDCGIAVRAEMERLKGEIDALSAEAVEVNGSAVNCESKSGALKKLYDYYAFKLEKIVAQGDFRRTERETTVVFEGWVPASDTEFITKKLEEVTERIYLEFTDPEKSDNPPTLTKNNKLVAPFEAVTNMYSAPSYRENDPNAAVMFFFFIFFGFMLSDAGYGIILAIGGYLMLKFIKMEAGMKRLVTVITLGGISTIIWGFLFGGFFSIEIKGTILEKLCWFTPLDNPLGVLGLSLALGLVQIMCGLALKAKQLIQDGHVFDALCDVGSWYLVFIGLIFIVLGSLVPGFEWANNVGAYVAIAGVVALVLTQGRQQKNVFMKLFKGIASLYGAVGYLSDLLSYSRLFGLGLATGVVGMVFNKIAEVFIGILGPWAGIPVAVVFVLFGHTLNICINTLGAYVHNCRLQYIEFFSRFYEGGGHVFVPFGSDTKYVNVV